ncbi:MAG: N-acetylmuramoyl-L-alanine amidase [Agathobacter sp.]|nr:N-acetylmuramoyl-L-alanine amidase [Agathobacter sp.]
MPKFFYGIIFSVVLLLLLYTFTKPSNEEPSSTEDLSSTENSTEDSAKKKEYPVIVLDAGHGGFDPGKVGVNGALEKDINLSIVKKLQTLLEEEGFTVHLTRETDTLLAPANSSSKKKDDMIARIEMITRLDPFFTISIHQNSFTDSASSGPQVFYYKDSEESATMAQVIQDALNSQLSPAKKRSPQANANYYLLTRTPTPTVIVECGFLSNPVEADLLTQDEYQSRVANSIFIGILSYYESTTSNQILSE